MSTMAKHQKTPPEPTHGLEVPVVPETEEEIHQEVMPALISVPVHLDRPATVQLLPSRVGPAFVTGLNSNWQSVLNRDPKRRRAVLMLASATASDTWLYSRTQGGAGVPWPANVPLVLEHADAVYASVGPGNPATTLTAITEMWAD